MNSGKTNNALFQLKGEVTFLNSVKRTEQQLNEVIISLNVYPH